MGGLDTLLYVSIAAVICWRVRCFLLLGVFTSDGGFFGHFFLLDYYYTYKSALLPGSTMDNGQ